MFGQGLPVDLSGNVEAWEKDETDFIRVSSRTTTSKSADLGDLGPSSSSHVGGMWKPVFISKIEERFSSRSDGAVSYLLGRG